ncbi:hypothetical protein, unlikely [Trypanosoma brucei brucei TREU927]|uniref:Uncharacterized protein n=1 Tax=Trypanosoma brucei brucei (strain 927/4 GUTat10.1) TaxID=185431 RepID=Q38EQ2_TRYB2|nr:hypothetical protein, unlikely [Trypanosoma brucei brucei TREU927]EAN76718.1 hypothetical protein, unlikely [Trypanosoma brucei brucei TREU927]
MEISWYWRDVFRVVFLLPSSDAFTVVWVLLMAYPVASGIFGCVSRPKFQVFFKIFGYQTDNVRWLEHKQKHSIIHNALSFGFRTNWRITNAVPVTQCRGQCNGPKKH